MNTFLHILGILSVIGGFLLAVMSMPNVGGALMAIVSGIVSLAVFWWMADVRASAERAADKLGEAVDLLKTMANQGGASGPAPSQSAPAPAATIRGSGAGSVTLSKGEALVGSRVRHSTFGEGTVEAVEGETATVRFDRREKPEPMNVTYLTVLERAAS